MRKIFGGIGLLLFLGGAGNSFSQTDIPALTDKNMVVLPTELECESVESPVIDTRKPYLSWVFSDQRRGASQTAYRILAASSLEKLKHGDGDLWDSGKVAGSQSVFIPYQGKLLQSRQRVWWKVKVWDHEGKETLWSAPGFWRMALLDEKDWRAQWIAAPEMDEPLSDRLDDFLTFSCTTKASKELFYKRKPTLCLRKVIRCQKGISDAIIRVCGLGAFNLYVNGEKVGRAFLDPIGSDFRKTAYYKTFDLSEMLNEGENVIALEVADGWYGQAVVWNGSCGYGFPKLLAEIEWMNGVGETHFVGTDSSWKVHYGPTLRSNIYAGEMFDARLKQSGWMAPGFDDSAWADAVQTAPGALRLASQTAPSIETIRRISPVSKWSPKPGVYVFDFGEHFSGVAKMRIRNAKPGQAVTVQFCDFLNPDRTVNHSLMAPCQVRQTQMYVCCGESVEEWTPSFTYFGFRYAEVRGLDVEPEMDFLEGEFRSAAVKPIGSFRCSSDLYNKMHRMAVQTLRSNIHGVIEDCPHREKCGWLGDAWMPIETWQLNLDLASFDHKFIDDIRRTYQPNGLLGDIAGGKRQHPFTAYRASPLDWMAATVILPFQHYVYTADRPELDRHYTFMTRFAEAAVPLVRERYASGKIDLVRKDRFFLGDWGDVTVDGKRRGDFILFPAETPAMLSGTQTLIYSLQCLALSAEALGHPGDQERYTAMAAELMQLANEAYFDPATASYGSQSANAWAFKLGMVPFDSQEAFLERFGREICEADQLVPTCGQMGLGVIFQSLTDAGHGTLVHALSDAKADHGFRRLIERGATTLWELQGRGEPVPTASGNHPAFSGYDAWFYQYLCGIRPDPASPGFKKFILQPWFDPMVDWAEASYKSPYGLIRSAWEKQSDGRMVWKIEIPANTSAELGIPMPSEDTALYEGNTLLVKNGQVKQMSKGVSYKGTVSLPAGCIARFTLQAGAYEFSGAL